MTFYFACQRGTLYIIQGHQHWRTWCTDKFLQRFRTAWVHVSTHYLFLTKPWPSRELCTFTHAEQFSIVCCDTYSFSPPKYQSRSCGKWDKHDCKNSHMVIISFLFTLPYVNLRLKYVWFSGYLTDNPYPPLPSLLTILKDFPIRQYSFRICPSRGHFYHPMRVLFSWTQLVPEHEINLRGAPPLLVLTTDVISEGSGEHVRLH